jgi:2-oxoglutarate ferredoxin oxidoreductase subunit delta
MYPVINWNKCDGCGRCVKTCPNEVLALWNLSPTDYNNLSWLGKLKTRRKGAYRSYVVNKDVCTGCGTCQMNCHERAVKLR